MNHSFGPTGAKWLKRKLMDADHKWGQAYLTREFFHRLGATLPQHVVLAVAQEAHSDDLVAGALNLLGSHALFGRNWGCASGCWIKHLHFELCYYQVDPVPRGFVCHWQDWLHSMAAGNFEITTFLVICMIRPRVIAHRPLRRAPHADCSCMRTVATCACRQ